MPDSKAIADMLNSNDPARRRRGIEAIAFSNDPRTQGILEHFAANDPENGIRELASRYLDSMQPAALVNDDPLEAMSRIDDRAMDAARDSANSVSSVSERRAAGRSGAPFGRGAPSRPSGKISAIWDCPMCGTTGLVTPTCPACGHENVTASAAPAWSTSAEPVTQPITRPPSQPAEPRQQGRPTYLPMREELFIIDPRHRAFVTGKSQRLPSKGSSCFSIAFGLVLMLAGFGFITFGLDSLNRMNDFIAHLTPAVATIIDKYESEDSEGDTTYSIRYRYGVGNSSYEATTSVGYNDYRNYTPNSSRVNIIYNANNPADSRLASQGLDTNLPKGIIGLGVFWIFLTALGLYRSAAYGDKLQKLAKHGTLLPGQITACDTYEDSDNDFTLRFTYQFETPSGKTILRKYHSMRNDLRNGPLPREGTQVRILYLNDKNWEAM